MHRLGTQHCVAMGSPPIPGRSVRSAPDTASMTEPLVIDPALGQDAEALPSVVGTGCVVPVMLSR